MKTKTYTCMEFLHRFGIRCSRIDAHWYVMRLAEMDLVRTWVGADDRRIVEVLTRP